MTVKTIKIPAAHALRPQDMESIEGRLKRGEHTNIDVWLLYHWCVVLLNVVSFLCTKLVKARINSDQQMTKELAELITTEVQTYNKALFESSVTPPSVTPS